MRKIAVYSFDAGRDSGYAPDYTTQDYREAIEYARANRYRIIVNEYRWFGREVDLDYTDDETPDDETTED